MQGRTYKADLKAIYLDLFDYKNTKIIIFIKIIQITQNLKLFVLYKWGENKTLIAIARIENNAFKETKK